MSECACVSGVYDFFVKPIGDNKLIYKDASNWMSEDNYQKADKYSLDIIPPGTSKKTTVEINVQTDNIISVFDKLKDGVWCFSILNCGTNYIKSVALFPNLRCCIKQAWATLDIDKQDKIREVESYLNSAATNAEFNNVKAAAQNLDIAEKLLKNLKCDCTC